MENRAPSVGARKWRGDACSKMSIPRIKNKALHVTHEAAAALPSLRASTSRGGGLRLKEMSRHCLAIDHQSIFFPWPCTSPLDPGHLRLLGCRRSIQDHACSGSNLHQSSTASNLCPSHDELHRGGGSNMARYGACHAQNPESIPSANHRQFVQVRRPPWLNIWEVFFLLDCRKRMMAWGLNKSLLYLGFYLDRLVFRFLRPM
jgi:hypothetical protein